MTPSSPLFPCSAALAGLAGALLGPLGCGAAPDTPPPPHQGATQAPPKAPYTGPPVRALTADELAQAATRLGRATDSLDAGQSFRLGFAPFDGDALVATRDCTLVWAEREQTLPLGNQECWGAVLGVAFWDLDDNGHRDVLGMAWRHTGAGGPASAYKALGLYLNDGTTLHASDWGETVPYDVVEAGLPAVRAHATTHPPAVR